MSFKYQAAPGKGGENNPAVETATKCCMCCLKCWENVVRYMQKMVYTVVLAESQNFCTAAETMVEIEVSQYVAMGLLAGATKMFRRAAL